MTNHPNRNSIALALPISEVIGEYTRPENRQASQIRRHDYSTMEATIRLIAPLRTKLAQSGLTIKIVDAKPTDAGLTATLHCAGEELVLRATLDAREALDSGARCLRARVHQSDWHPIPARPVVLS